MATRCIPNGERVGQFHFLSASISECMLLALNFRSLARNNGAVGRKPKIETTCVLSEFIMLSCMHIHYATYKTLVVPSDTKCLRYLAFFRIRTRESTFMSQISSRLFKEMSTIDIIERSLQLENNAGLHKLVSDLNGPIIFKIAHNDGVS